MHVSLHLKESSVNGCIDEALWGLKALHRVETSECAKRDLLLSTWKWTFFSSFSKSCVYLRMYRHLVFCLCESPLTHEACSHMLHLQYEWEWKSVPNYSRSTELQTRIYMITLFPLSTQTPCKNVYSSVVEDRKSFNRKDVSKNWIFIK